LFDGVARGLPGLCIVSVQFSHGAMQHFLCEAFGQSFHHGFNWLTFGKQFLGAGQFRRAPSLGLLPE